MICSQIQIDSFWKTFVLSNDCESSMRAIVIEPPCCGVAAFLEGLEWAVAAAASSARPASSGRAASLYRFTSAPFGGG